MSPKDKSSNGEDPAILEFAHVRDWIEEDRQAHREIRQEVRDVSRQFLSLTGQVGELKTETRGQTIILKSLETSMSDLKAEETARRHGQDQKTQTKSKRRWDLLLAIMSPLIAAALGVLTTLHIKGC